MKHVMDEMTPYEVLTKAQDLIRDPKNWTQGQYARQKYGAPVSPLHKGAVCFCSHGAMIKIQPEATNQRIAARILLRNCMEFSIADFNDSHTHAEVMNAFDRARELASQEKQA